MLWTPYSEAKLKGVLVSEHGHKRVSRLMFQRWSFLWSNEDAQGYWRGVDTFVKQWKSSAAFIHRFVRLEGDGWVFGTSCEGMSLSVRTRRPADWSLGHSLTQCTEINRFLSPSLSLEDLSEHVWLSLVKGPKAHETGHRNID